MNVLLPSVGGCQCNALMRRLPSARINMKRFKIIGHFPIVIEVTLNLVSNKVGLFPKEAK